MLSVPPVFQRPFEQRNDADAAHAKFHSIDGDHFVLLNIYEEYEREGGGGTKWCWNNFLNERPLKSAQNVRNQLKLLLEKEGFSVRENGHLGSELYELYKEIHPIWILHANCHNRTRRILYHCT